jgi:hypothetical protein
MNEPANFVAGDLYEGCATNEWNNPPYLPSKLIPIDLCIRQVLHNVSYICEFITVFLPQIRNPRRLPSR